MQKGNYPNNWEEVAFQVKQAADWKCERCGRPHSPQDGYTLTVHHLNKNPANSDPSNLAALCQRCHLHLQNNPLYALFNQQELFDPFEARWLNKHKRITIFDKKGPTNES